MTRESERLNSIITDFLAYSRGKQYHFAQVDLVPLLEDTLTLLEHRLEARKRRHPHRAAVMRPQKALALADGDKIKQVFWNFCENAVRAMKTRRHADRQHRRRSADDWQFNFADTGPGMSPQHGRENF